jgi:hypothetical protein
MVNSLEDRDVPFQRGKNHLLYSIIKIISSSGIEGRWATFHYKIFGFLIFEVPLP